MGASPGENSITRRDFLKKVGAGAAAVVSLSAGGVSLLKPPTVSALPISQGVVFPDPTLCIGCLSCEVVCGRWHREQGLSALPRIRILDDPTVQPGAELVAHYPGRGSHRQLPCKHCPEPECLEVCPADALRLDEKTGARYIDEARCIACGRCEEACPFEVDESKATNGYAWGQRKRIMYDPDKNVYVKCDLCRGREAGPICVERCPVNIRIRQGIVNSDHLTLDLPVASREIFDEMRNL